jgi:carbon-monoxide dehydrogenase medium subunit
MLLFDYHRPTTVAETAALMADLGEEAELLAGGTSLMNLVTLGLARPAHVIALGGVDELRGLRAAPDGGLQVGATTTVRDVEVSPLVRGLTPGLALAARHVATVRIRNQATVGGNLVHADPNQDLPPMLMVYDAVARISGPAGERYVPVADLFLGFFQTVVGAEEIVHSVVVPAPAAALRTGYLKFLPRTKDDYSTVAVAAGLTVDEGRVSSARLAVAGGGPTAIRCTAAEQALLGAAPGDGTALTDALDPISDARGSSRYKREMARVCADRLLHRLAGEGAG